MTKHTALMRDESIPKALWKLSLPSTIAMLVGSLYNITDRIFVGQGVGPLAFGGLTITFPVQILIMGIAQMVGLGASSIVSRALGAKDTERANTAAANSFIYVLVFSAVMMVLGLIYLDPLLRAFGATDALLPYARDYMEIMMFGMIFATFPMSANSLIRAEGNAKMSMFVMVLGMGSNIILDPIFIFVFDMGVAGAAWATVIARALGTFVTIGYFTIGKSALSIRPRHFKVDVEILWETLSLGIASFVRQVSGSLVSIMINHSLKFYAGDIPAVLAGESVTMADVYITFYGVFNSIIMVLFTPLFGIVQGFMPLTGFNYGARNKERVKETVKTSVIWITGIALVGFFLIELIPSGLIKIFTQEALILEIGSQPMRVLALFFPLIGFQIIGASLFQAVGKARPSLILSLSRQVLFLIPLMFVLPLLMPKGMEIAGLVIAFPIADLLSFIVTAILVKLEYREINAMEPPEEPKAAPEF